MTRNLIEMPPRSQASSGSARAFSWWKKDAIYQIYPLSFMDSDGDGKGDLPGMAERLDYCRWLGAGAVWLSPIYPSPMIDFGYDVADYTDVHPMFGTMADFDALMNEARRLGLKVLLDFVPNHSSDQHRWFLQSRSSRDNPHRDWYIWRDPAPGGSPPNNWLAVFGGRAWQWDESTGQYYLHSYLKEQPDLNWRNRDLQAAMLDAMKFWLERGVAGFRLDSISHLMKDSGFRNNPINPNWQPSDGPYYRYLPIHSNDHPDTPAVIRRMRRVVDSYEDRVIIGEAYLSLQRTVAYYGAGIHLPFNFALIHSPWNARAVHATIESYEALLAEDQWPNWVLGNHDRHRIASRIGRAQARVAAMLLLTLRGTPTLYYGDEIAMQDIPISPDLVKDPWEKNVPALGLGRDPERSPMQWNSQTHAGFTTGTPWLAVADDFKCFNVAVQSGVADSSLALYRRLLALRADKAALHAGDYGKLLCDDHVLAYSRRAAREHLWIALNLTDQPRQFSHPELHGGMILSTALDRWREAVDVKLSLRANEGVIVQLDGSMSQNA